jgi:hypothetical protein
MIEPGLSKTLLLPPLSVNGVTSPLRTTKVHD